MHADLSDDLTHWLAENLASTPPPENIVAFNIGLFEVEDGFCAYLMGSANFDANDGEWAVNPPYKQEAYFSLPKATYKFEDWQTCLESVVAAVSVALANPQLVASPIFRANAVTVGFDDGDLHQVK